MSIEFFRNSRREFRKSYIFNLLLLLKSHFFVISEELYHTICNSPIITTIKIMGLYESAYTSGLVDVTVLAVRLCKRLSEPRSGAIISWSISISTAAYRSCGAMAGSTLFTLKLLRAPLDVTNVSW